MRWFFTYLVLETFWNPSSENMNLKLIILIFASFADAFRRSGFFKFHGHGKSEKTEIKNHRVKNIRRVMIKRNQKLMRLIANIESMEKRDALMGALSKPSERSKQQLRLVSKVLIIKLILVIVIGNSHFVTRLFENHSQNHALQRWSDLSQCCNVKINCLKFFEQNHLKFNQ